MRLQEKAALSKELSALKRSTRATKVSELQAEVAALQDEIHRQLALQKTMTQRVKQLENNAGDEPIMARRARNAVRAPLLKRTPV